MRIDGGRVVLQQGVVHRQQAHPPVTPRRGGCEVECGGGAEEDVVGEVEEVGGVAVLVHVLAIEAQEGGGGGGEGGEEGGGRREEGGGEGVGRGGRGRWEGRREEEGWGMSRCS